MKENFCQYFNCIYKNHNNTKPKTLKNIAKIKANPVQGDELRKTQTNSNFEGNKIFSESRLPNTKKP